MSLDSLTNEVLTMSKKMGTPSTVHYSPARIRRMERAIENKAKRRAARSGDVVTRMIGDEKVTPPAPTATQIRRQEKRL